MLKFMSTALKNQKISFLSKNNFFRQLSSYDKALKVINQNQEHAPLFWKQVKNTIISIEKADATKTPLKRKELDKIEQLKFDLIKHNDYPEELAQTEDVLDALNKALKINS